LEYRGAETGRCVFRPIIQIGAAVLAFTAAKMIVNEPLLAQPVWQRTPCRWTRCRRRRRWTTYSVAVDRCAGRGLVDVKRQTAPGRRL